MTAKQIIDNDATILDCTSMLHKKIVLSIIRSKHFENVVNEYYKSMVHKKIIKDFLRKELVEKEKELEAVANQLTNANQQSDSYAVAMATMQMENEALKEEVKKLKEYIRDSNI
jgi:flagellar basal body-associated protein FliL